MLLLDTQECHHPSALLLLLLFYVVTVLSFCEKRIKRYNKILLYQIREIRNLSEEACDMTRHPPAPMFLKIVLYFFSCCLIDREVLVELIFLLYMFRDLDVNQGK